MKEYFEAVPIMLLKTVNLEKHEAIIISQKNRIQNCMSVSCVTNKINVNRKKWWYVVRLWVLFSKLFRIF